MSRNPFSKAVAKLYIALEHEEKEEVSLYYEFKTIVRELVGGAGPFFASPYAKWYSKNVIFKNFAQSFARRAETGKKIWSSFSAAAVSTCVREVRTELRHSETQKYIAFIIGGLAGLNKLGHCIVSF